MLTLHLYFGWSIISTPIAVSSWSLTRLVTWLYMFAVGLTWEIRRFCTFLFLQIISHLFLHNIVEDCQQSLQWERFWSSQLRVKLLFGSDTAGRLPLFAVMLHEEPLVWLGWVVGSQKGSNEEELGIERKLDSNSVNIRDCWSNGGQRLNRVRKLFDWTFLLVESQHLLTGHFSQVDGGQTFLEMRLNVGPKFLWVWVCTDPWQHWLLIERIVQSGDMDEFC